MHIIIQLCRCFVSVITPITYGIEIHDLTHHRYKPEQHFTYQKHRFITTGLVTQFSSKTVVYFVDSNFKIATASVYLFIEFPEALIRFIIFIRYAIEYSTKHANIINIHLISTAV
ncbi:hypothetical protein A9R12_02870 [Aeromonas hydrophila]|nr:hypothetical protein A9R12_02870 [Aeromonas hydrophila]